MIKFVLKVLKYVFQDFDYKNIKIFIRRFFESEGNQRTSNLSLF